MNITKNKWVDSSIEYLRTLGYSIDKVNNDKDSFYFEYLIDTFFDINQSKSIKNLLHKNNSLLSMSKRVSIIIQLYNVLDLPGNIIEIGVYKGGSAELICSSVKIIGGLNKSFKVFLFDSFAGFTNEDLTLENEKKLVGSFQDVNVDELEKKLCKFKFCKIIKENFSENTLHYIENLKFKFVHLDCDTYSSTFKSLTLLAPRMVQHGVIVIDDTNSTKSNGVRSAVSKFLKTKPMFQLSVGPIDQVILSKKV